MNPKVYQRIRKKIIRKLKPNSVNFILSGGPIRKSADGVYPFFANRNFVYATGIKEPQAVLVFDLRKEKPREILFIREIDPFMEKWVGLFIRKEKAQEISGLEDVRYFNEFETYLDEVKKSKCLIGLDYDHDQHASEFYESARGMKKFFKKHELYDIFPIFVENRMVKEPEEIEKIEAAIDLTHQAINSMLFEMAPGRNEKEMEARFVFEGHRHGAMEMFDTIVASGKNATILHYIENDQELEDGELVLVDLGLSLDNYGADISRTYPVNGKFSSRQKEVYGEVLNTFKAVNKKIRPGISLAELNGFARESLAQACVRLGLIENLDDVDQYYYHSIGHSLGLDTHDLWSDREAPLRAGNVITNEPGLYIAEEGIGIRLETDILVTEDGNRDLGPQIEIEIEDVENLLKKRG